MKITHYTWLLAATLLSNAAAAQDVLLAQVNAETETAITAPVIAPPSKLTEKHIAETSAEEVPISGVLTLKDAIDKTIENTPRLKSADAARNASKALRAQAGVLPNPEMGLEAENFSGSGPYSGFDASEVTLGVSQLIELGGKRSNRQAAAAQNLRLSDFDYESEHLDIIRDVTIAYVEVIAAQEEVKLTAEQKELAGDLLKEVKERVNAAREPLIQHSKAQIIASTSNFAHDRAMRELDHARHVLASLWGGHHEIYTLDTESFFMLADPMTEAQIESALEKNPNLKRWDAVKSRSVAQLNLEKAQAVPNPRVSIGIRDFRGTDSQALLAGISIPIPVLDSNRGNIESARFQAVQAESDEAANKLNVRNAAFEAYEAMINGYHQAETLKDSIIPAAEKSFRLSREGYRAGRFAYLEVLDSQRTLFDARAQYIAALRDYHKARAETERFTATHATQKEKQGEFNAH